MTDKQERFVEMVVRGVSLEEAARQAGYRTPASDGPRLALMPELAEAIVEQRRKLVELDLANVASSCLRELIESKDTPPNVRFLASKWALEVAGHQSGKDVASTAPEKPLHEMSTEELTAFVEAGKKAVCSEERNGRKEAQKAQKAGRGN